MNSKSSIITIGREYGSGGRQIGQEVAKYLGIKCYDKELLQVAANESGLCEELFASQDEKPTNSSFILWLWIHIHLVILIHMLICQLITKYSWHSLMQ